MATNDLSTKEKICDAALALLRQDIGYATSQSVSSKCDNVWKVATQTLMSAHNWKDGWGTGTDPVPVGDHVRGLLVYCLARELAIPITGRADDFKNIDALFNTKLQHTKSKDLEDEMTALRAQTDDDSKFAVQVLDTLKQFYSYADGDLGNGRPKAQPRGIAALKAHINSVKENIRKEILLTHDWSFAKKEVKSTSVRTEDGRFRTEYPGESVKIIKCFGGDGSKIETVLREGHFMYSYEPITRIVFLCDDVTTEDWTPLVKKAYINKVAEAVAVANPELYANSNKISQVATIAKNALDEAKQADARQSFAGTNVYGRNYLYDIATGKRKYRR